MTARASVAVPGRQTVGMLVAGRREPHGYSESDVRFLLPYPCSGLSATTTERWSPCLRSL